ncbi:hypothetical protein F4703DRAFT_1934639 [Phycomyces blakesleeanus]
MSFHLWKAGVPFCNVYMSIDECLKATSEQSSQFGLCYSNGKTIIPLPIATLQKLLDFVTNHDSSDRQATNFYKNIRAFNSAFAFASIKANVNERLASGTDSISTFHVNSTIYHNVGALRSLDPRAAEFSQIYFCCTNEQLARRTTLFSGLDIATIERIQNIINTCNLYTCTLISVAEQSRDKPFGSLPVIIRAARDIHHHYDIQSSSEVAAMIIEESVDRTSVPHDIVIIDCITGH